MLAQVCSTTPRMPDSWAVWETTPADGFSCTVNRLLLKSPLADPPQVYCYALLVCKFGTEIVALTLHFCFDCGTIVAGSAIELDEICLNYSKSFHSLNAQIP